VLATLRTISGSGVVLPIYGVNQNARDPNVIVIVGGINCPTFLVLDTRSDCILYSPGGNGTVAIIVQNGAATSTFERGYRYIQVQFRMGVFCPVIVKQSMYKRRRVGFSN
jgi:hypothetical protein